MENLRQRTKREVEAASQFAIQRFCKDIISVADILEMALSSTNKDSDATKQLGNLLSGLDMTLGELHKVFSKHGLSIVDPVHQKFDPNIHNAMYELPTEEFEPGTVIKVQKKGYMLNQRVIRPADVGVSKKP
jgi:molecular chaperone GrpE